MRLDEYLIALDRLRSLRADDAPIEEQDSVREDLELADELLSDDERAVAELQWWRGWP